MLEKPVDERIRVLERDNRQMKLLLLAAIVSFCTIAAMKTQVQSSNALDANRIIFRRSDGAVVAELRVEGKDELYDLTLRDAKGAVRLSFAGLDGMNLPPYSGMHFHDPRGEERISLIADDDTAGIAIGSSNPKKELSYSGASPVRASLRVEKETGILRFFGSDSKLLYSIPSTR